MSISLQPHGLQHARLSCPSLSPGVYSNSWPLSKWCHPTISSSVIPFSSCPQSFLLPSKDPASGSFPMSQFFTSGGQSIGTSASVLPVNIQDWFPLGLTGLIYIYLSSRSSLWNIGVSVQFLKAESVIGAAWWCETWLGVGVRKPASLLWAPGIGFCRDFWAVCRRLPSLVPGLQHLSSSFPPLLAEYFLVSTPLRFCNSFVQGLLVRILDLEDDTMTEIWRNLQMWLWWKT